MPRLKEKYLKEIRPALKEKLGLSNVMEVPRLEKIVVNMGVGEAAQDAKILDEAIEVMRAATGQNPQIRRARKSVAGFKIRAGMPVGLKVTLRGDRMYEFLDRLISIVLPRVRDFRGISPKQFDGNGNYTFGVKEQIIFPEIDLDKIQHTLGMDITIVTSTSNDEHAKALLEAFGFPFKKV
ncbi:MAG: 50S ribosomal protein L5 [Actinobacteria bacterium]|nr:50S ribosomal protein L5 [Actinomycetota bacterium]